MNIEELGWLVITIVGLIFIAGFVVAVFNQFQPASTG